MQIENIQKKGGGKQLKKKLLDFSGSEVAPETRPCRRSTDWSSGRIKSGREEKGAEPHVWSWWNSAHRNL